VLNHTISAKKIDFNMKGIELTVLEKWGYVVEKIHLVQ
jgi:hypothetical protein